MNQLSFDPLTIIIILIYRTTDLDSSSPKLEENRLKREKERRKMVKLGSFFAMTLGAFVFWQSMDKVHVWIALHQDEKREKEEKEREVRKVREELIQQAKQKDSIA